MIQKLSLYRLQQTDTVADRAQARLQVIQRMLADKEALGEAARQAETQEQNRLTAERLLHQAEQTVQDQRIKIEQAESSLYSGNIHSPKELQDLQNDVAALKRHLMTLEDRQLEAMLALEETEAAHKSAQEALEFAQSQWMQQNQNLCREQENLLKELDILQTERQAISGAISPENMELYLSLRQQRRGLAVAEISDNACAACGSVLTPAQRQSARSVSQTVFCPSCGRILFGN